MKTILSLISLVIVTIALSSRAPAQADAGPAWQVLGYDINASTQPGSRLLIANARLTVRNVGRGSGARITLRINSKAEIKSATANDAVTTFRVSQDAKTNQQRVEVILPAAVAPNASFNVSIDYQIPIAENNGLAAISPLGVQFLPASSWYPTPANAMSPRGPDTAPFRLKINSVAGDTLVSAGKSNAGTFDQALYGQPFFISGSWDISAGSGEALGISAYLAKGSGTDEQKRGESMIAIAGSARSYFASMLGPAPDVPIRLVEVTRGAGFCDSGTIFLDAAAFRRSKVDVLTAMQIAEMVARLWLGGKTALRAEGYGVIREGLVRHLATLFIEKQFGADTSEAERLRQRLAFVAIAKRDAPLSMTTPLDDSYFTLVGNKGAFVWRLIERAIGRDVFMEMLRDRLQAGAEGGAGLTLAALREALSLRGGVPIRNILDYELDKPSDTDLMTGLPQLKGNEWVVALRNVGSIDVATSVVGITETGERLKSDVTIPARNFGEAVFKTAAKLRRVEVDPEKLYPQVDYANDIAPRLTTGDEPLVEATRLFQRQDYARAETILRELIAAMPYAEEARVMLARTLEAQNKIDLAEKEFRGLLEARAPSSSTLAWANIGLAEMSLQRGQAAQAVRHFDEAVRAGAEYGTTLAARAGRIKAEAAAKNTPTPDESARAFVAQLDKAILSGRKADVDTLIVSGELTAFSRGVVGSQPEVWQTHVVRTEQLNATSLVVDVTINLKQLGREQSGTAVLILARVGGNWKLAGIELLEVR